MSVNKVNLRLDKRMTNNVKTLNRYVRELKTPQKAGADIITVAAVPFVGTLGGGITLPAGATGSFVVSITPADSTLTLWNFLFSIAIDVADFTNNVFPNGPSVTANMRSMRLYNWIDWATSSDTSNKRVVNIRIENTDTSSHDYYLALRSYLPELPGTA
jgi:hypothetical protein